MTATQGEHKSLKIFNMCDVIWGKQIEEIRNSFLKKKKLNEINCSERKTAFSLIWFFSASICYHEKAKKIYYSVDFLFK